MELERSSGVLLHITSLPGRSGIGTLGKNAYQFIDFLEEAYQKNWQILPTGPTGYGDSPYQTFSAFAGNPLLIDLQKLVDIGLLQQDQISLPAQLEGVRIDFGALINWKIPILKIAFTGFQETAEYKAFCNKQAFWLEEYAMFMALKQKFNGKSWSNWEKSYKFRETDALSKARNELDSEIKFQKFLQFMFFQQWQELKTYIKAKGISVIGDLPIFIAMDSADAWAKHEIFQFDQQLNPTAVAGVPPDYFSETGQLWGNPLYNWESLQENDFKWWKERFRASLAIADLIRVDHFRGFAGYWSVPYGEENAVRGKWIKAPGVSLFQSLQQEFAELPIIAEDLGVITEDVVELRDKFGFPGMKILQFAFGTGPENAYLPENYQENCVVFTGTHDNDTTVGWFRKLPDNLKKDVCDYLKTDGSNIHWDLIRTAWRSRANLAITPMQDLLGLDSEARMNTPANLGDNWQWRLRETDLNLELAHKLRDLTWECDR